MVNFRIKGETIPEVILALQQDDSDTTINLIAQDETNARVYILGINENGALELYENVPRDMGFALDKDGRIKIEAY